MPSAESAILQWRRTWKREAAGLGLVTTATTRVEREVHSSGVPLKPLGINITRDERELLFEHLNFIGLRLNCILGTSTEFVLPPNVSIPSSRQRPSGRVSDDQLRKLFHFNC